MARPSKAEKAKIAANKAAKREVKATYDKRDAQLFARVQTVIDDALKHSRSASALELTDLAPLLEKLERAYRLAMSTSQPNAAVNAVMAQGKLRGLLIDQHAVAVGSPQEFREFHGSAEELRQRVLGQLIDRGYSPDKAQRLITKLEQARAEVEDEGVVDVEGNAVDPDDP